MWDNKLFGSDYGYVSSYEEKVGADGLTRHERDVLYGDDWLDTDVLAVKAGLPRPERKAAPAPSPEPASQPQPKPPRKSAAELRGESEARKAAEDAQRAAQERTARLRALGVDLEKSTVSGYAARFGMNRRSCFWSTTFDDWLCKLARRDERVPFLGDHAADLKIGESLELLNDHHGIYGRWRIDHAATLERVAELVEAGTPPGLSVGVDATNSKRVPSIPQIFQQAECHEISLLLNQEPACPDARIGPPDSVRDLEAARASVPGQIKRYWSEWEADHERRMADIAWRERQARWCRAG